MRLTRPVGAPRLLPVTDPAPEKTGAGRPLSVTVIGIFAIVMGALGLLSSPLAILPWIIDMGPNPVLDIARRHRPMYGWMLLSIVVTPFLSLALIVGGIGLLRLWPAAWRAMYAYVWVSFGFVVIGTILNAVYLVPGLVRLDVPTRIATLFSMGFSVLASLGFSATVLAVLTRPEVKQVFGRDAR